MSPQATLATRLAAATPDALTAAAALAVWIAPRAFGAHAVSAIVVLMLLELVALHMGLAAWGALLRARGDRGSFVRLTLANAALYGAIGIALAFGTGQPWPLLALAWLVGPRIASLVASGSAWKDEASRQVRTWGVSLVLYVAVTALSVMVPVPELGIDASVRAAVELPSERIRVEQHQGVVAAAVAYFALLAVFRWFTAPPRSR